MKYIISKITAKTSNRSKHLEESFGNEFLMPTAKPIETTTNDRSRRRRQVWCANELMSLTMRKRGKRVSILSWLLGWVAFSIRVRPLSAQDSEYNIRATTCSDGNTLGYVTLEELNQDILEERTRIEEGGEPYNPYLFTLCPQTVFDAEGNTIVPSLNNILIGCGAPPVSTNQCVLLNGDVQVAIGDFLDTDIPVETVRLSGMTFSSFTGSAIAGGASFGTRVELFDSIFEVSHVTKHIRFDCDFNRILTISLCVFLIELSKFFCCFAADCR